jgi:hypothetical protein
LIVSRTKGVSAAFIKELMRRCARFQIECSRGDMMTEPSVDAAIEEMLFAGGALNRRLLRGRGRGGERQLSHLQAISDQRRVLTARYFKADS